MQGLGRSVPYFFAHPRKIGLENVQEKGKNVWKLCAEKIREAILARTLPVFYSRVPITEYGKRENPREHRTRNLLQQVCWVIKNIAKNTKYAPPTVWTCYQAFVYNAQQLHELYGRFNAVSLTKESDDAAAKEINKLALKWVREMQEYSGKAELSVKNARRLQSLGLTLLRDISSMTTLSKESAPENCPEGFGVNSFDKVQIGLGDPIWESLEPISDPLQEKIVGNYRELKEYALEYLRKNQHDGCEKGLTEGQKRQLRKLARRENFLEAVVFPKRIEGFEDDFNLERRAAVLHLLFGTNLSTKLLVSYPALVDFFKSARMLNFLGGCGKKMLRLNAKDHRLEIKVDGKFYPFHLDQKITFRSGKEKTIAEIMEHFASTKECRYEYLITPEKGVIEYGFYTGLVDGKAVSMADHLDKEDPDYPIHNILTKKQALATLPPAFDPDAPCSFILMASQEVVKDGRTAQEVLKEGAEISNLHGWFQLVVNRGDGNYEIIAPGVYPGDFPTSIFGFLNFLGNTAIGKLLKIDSNNFYFNRAHVELLFSLTDQDMPHLKHILGDMEKKSSEGNLPFAFLDQNCIKNAASILDYLSSKRRDRGEPGFEYPSLKLNVGEVRTYEKPLQKIIDLSNKLKPYPLAEKIFNFFIMRVVLRIQRGFSITDENGNKRKVRVIDGLFADTHEVNSPAQLFKYALGEEGQNDPKVLVRTGLRDPYEPKTLESSLETA